MNPAPTDDPATPAAAATTLHPEKKRAAFLGDAEKIGYVFGPQGLEETRQLTDLRPGVLTADQWQELEDVQWIFSTWGMPVLTARQLEQLPALEAVFYAAGSVRHFATPLLEREILVVTARAANAVPVAEFTLAQILLSCKNYFANIRATAAPWGTPDRPRSSLPLGQGVWQTPVALLGFGTIARLVARHLQQFSFRVMVVDPLIDPADLEDYDAEPVTLEQAFAEAEVVSNHLPNLPTTQGLLTGKHFAAMRRNATFINTGRGAQVVEPEMIQVLRERPDLTALLDVTYPEPPPPGSPFYDLPNCHISTHIAGSMGREVRRMAQLVLDDARRLLRHESPHHAVTLDMLEHMA